MESTTEILSFDTCPNCGGKNFIVEKRTCLECGYSLGHNTVIGHYPYKLAENLSEQPSFKRKNIKIKKHNFESYKVLVEGDKIKWIKFYVCDEKFGKKAFLLHIEYDTINKNFDEIEFYETDPEEKIHHYEIHKIELKPIKYIFEKAKVGYKEKRNLSYYKQIDPLKLQEFIKEIIKKHHNFI